MTGLTRIRLSAVFLSTILFLALAVAIPVSLLSQTASKKQDSRLNTTELVPEWKMSDEEFKEFLLQVEAVLPVYESSLNDLEAYIGKQQNLPYIEGKLILDDVNEGRSDIEDLRRTIKSLHGKRNIIDELYLAKAMMSTCRDEIDLELNERMVAFTEYQHDIHFPSPSGLSGCGKQFLNYAQRVEDDYMYRVMFLETQLYISRNSHTR